jgi:hypothetical protein
MEMREYFTQNFRDPQTAMHLEDEVKIGGRGKETTDR